MRRTSIGINELESQYSGTTLFNSVVTVGPDGTLLNRHRKLMPTNPERMVWGMGDASGLKVVDTPAGRLGSLICWESYMPLARYALYAQGIDIYVAPTWDTGESWVATMRHIAKEAGCWVIGTATALQGNDIPADFPDRDKLFTPDETTTRRSGGKPCGRDRGRHDKIARIAPVPEIDREAAGCGRSSRYLSHYSRPMAFFFVTAGAQPVRFRLERGLWLRPARDMLILPGTARMR